MFPGLDLPCKVDPAQSLTTAAEESYDLSDLHVDRSSSIRDVEHFQVDPLLYSYYRDLTPPPTPPLLLGHRTSP